MSRRLTCLWLLAIAWLVPAAAAAPPSARLPLADHFLESWTTREGLPHNLVLDLAQTADGYLWLGTWEGIVRFNGHEFEVLDRTRLPGLSDNGIRALHVGASGSLWFATARGGVVRLQGGGWDFINRDRGLEFEQIMRVRESGDGTLWILTEDAGLERRRGGEVRRFGSEQGLPSDLGFDLLELGPDRMLVATGAGLALVEGDAARALGADHGLPAGATLSLAQGPDGRIYVGTERGVYFAAQDMHFSLLHPGLSGEAVQTLLADEDGTLWIGSIGSGLFRLSELGLENLDVAQGLPNGRVAAILRDHERSLWVSTNAGLVRLREAPFRSFGVERGLAGSYVRAIIEDAGGTTWVGTSDGLSRAANDHFEPVGASLALPGLSILSLGLGRDGSLWVGTYYNGVARVRNGRVEAVYDQSHGLPGNSVRAILEARDGSVWFGTATGLARLSEDRVESFGLAQGLPREFVISLHEDREGAIWAGTTRGLARVHPGAIEAFDLTAFGGAHRIFGIAEDDDGTLWFATDRGLVLRRDGRFSHLGTDQGLPYDSVFAAVHDDQGGVWLTGNRGILRLDRRQALEVAAGRQSRLSLEQYGEADGMSSQQCNGGSWPSAIRRSDGSLWFATADGVASVSPARRRFLPLEPPPVVIERVRVDDRERSPRAPITLEPDTRRVEITYAGLGFVDADRIRYRYQLEGFDPDWVEAGSSRLAQFTNLRPGDYRLRVAAARSGGPWSTREATLDMTLPPRLWQREAFLPALLLGLAALALGWYRWRVRRLRADAVRLSDLVESRTLELRRQTQSLQQADSEKSALLSELQRQSQASARQAREDQLTGLANRRAFDEALALEFARAAQQGRLLCLALIDVDHFKRVNDDHSHAAGDAVLRRIAQVLRDSCSGQELAARWGGEEFTVLLPGLSLEAACLRCESLRKAVESLHAEDIAPHLALSISVGVASNAGLSHHERMLVRADRCLYAAKQSGRNRVVA